MGRPFLNRILLQPGSLPLDWVNAPFLAYSMRQLRTNYTGPCLRVRRSSDNAEQDIGFAINGVLDTTSLLSFVGANNGRIVTWYDQSGQGLNVAQSTGSSQPTIVSSGSLITQNNSPAIDFDGSSWRLTGVTGAAALLSNATGLYLSHIHKPDNFTAQRYLAAWTTPANTSNRLGVRLETTAAYAVVGRRLDSDSFTTSTFIGSTAPTELQIMGVSINLSVTNDDTLYRNGTLFGPMDTFSPGSNFDTTVAGSFTIGALGTNTPGAFYDGKVGEFVAIKNGITEQQRLDIQFNQAKHWGITLA